MVRRLLRRLGVTSAFGLGAFLGWMTAVLMAAWASKNMDKLVEKQIAKDLMKRPIRVTED